MSMTAILASWSTIEYKLGKGWWISFLEKKVLFWQLSELREDIYTYIHIHSKFGVNLFGTGVLHLNFSTFCM
jgi:hypothetical protein